MRSTTRRLIAGNPDRPVIRSWSHAVQRPYNVGDGLLPSDMDGTTLPPAGSPNYYVGSMDNGGPYSAPQSADPVEIPRRLRHARQLDLRPGQHDPPIAAYDTMLSICRRPLLHPAAGHDLQGQPPRLPPATPYTAWPIETSAPIKSLVTNQSVEATTGMSGIRSGGRSAAPNSSPIVLPGRHL